MREMKDSGIEWIGVIPQDWEIVRTKSLYCSAKEIAGDRVDDFERLALTLNGVIKRSKEDSVGLQPEKFSGYQILKKGELVFKLIDLENVATSRVGLSPYTGIVSPAYIVLSKQSRVKDLVVRYSMYHFLSMWQREIFNQMGDNGVRSSLNTKELLNIPHPFPSICEQKRIVTFLDAQCAEIDAVLEKTRASIEEYKKLKQAVITQAVTKGIRGDRPMKDSGIEWIGEIPVEWDVVRQKYFWNTVESGVSVNAADKPVDNSEQYGVLKTSAVSKFVFIPTEHKQVNLDEYGRVSCPVRADSIIASRMNTPELVGACGYVQNNYPNLFLPDRLWQITFKDGLSPKYAWYYLSGIRVRQYISSLSTGTSSSMQNISQSQYGNIFITIPSIGEQSEITKYLDEKCRSVDALVTKKQQYLTEIENYKKSLIYEYVTGKKEVV